MLVNRQGYWILAPRDEQQWGFMFDNDRTFPNAYPKQWSAIVERDSGSIRSDEGLFSFDTIYPLHGGQNSSSGAAAANGASERDLDAQEYYWKTIMHVGPERLREVTYRQVKNGSLTYLLFLLCAVPGAWLLARAREHNRVADATIKVSEERYRSLCNSIPWTFFATDKAGKILSVNHYGARHLGSHSCDLLGRSLLDVIHDEDHALAKHQLCACVQKPYFTHTCEIRMLWEKDERMFTRMTTRLVKGIGDRDEIIVVCEDITQSRKAEGRT